MGRESPKAEGMLVRGIGERIRKIMRMSLVYHGYPCPLPSHPLRVLILCGYLLSPALFLAGPTQIVPSSAVHTGSMAWSSWLSGLHYHILGAGLHDYVFLLPHLVSQSLLI